MKTSRLKGLVVALVTFLVAVGCSGGGEETNADALKNYKVPPSNNPDVPAVDGANKEFGPKGKGPK